MSQSFSLPNDWVSFSMFAIILALLCGGLILHIQLSSQILRIQMQIAQLEMTYDNVEHQNAELIWQISRHAALSDIRQRAEAMGYVPATQQYYVAVGDLGGQQFASRDNAQEIQPGALSTPATQLATADGAQAASLLPAEISIAPQRGPEWTVQMHQRISAAATWLQNWWKR